MSKISRGTLYEAIASVLQHSSMKRRNFTETVELQITLKNYNTQKDKRFCGMLHLKHVPRPRLRVCVIGNQSHCDEAKANNIAFRDIDSMKSLRTMKNRKMAVKKFFKNYDVFLASSSLIKQIPRLIGPSLGKAGKFPKVVTNEESLVAKVEEVRSTIKYQLKKTLCLAVAVGHVAMTSEQLATNVNMAVNFLVSLLKKNWQNVGALYIKSTMGPPQQIY